MDRVYVKNEIESDVGQACVLRGGASPNDLCFLRTCLVQHFTRRVDTPGGATGLRLDSTDIVAGAAAKL